MRKNAIRSMWQEVHQCSIKGNIFVYRSSNNKICYDARLPVACVFCNVRIYRWSPHITYI